MEPLSLISPHLLRAVSVSWRSRGCPEQWNQTIQCLCDHKEVTESVGLSVLSNSLQPHGLGPARLLCLWNSPGKNSGVVILFSRGSSQPRNQTWVSCLAGRFFATWPPGKLSILYIVVDVYVSPNFAIYPFSPFSPW